MCESLGAFSLVTSVTYLLTKNISTALILGAVSSATAPAATVIVLKENKAKGSLTSTLLGGTLSKSPSVVRKNIGFGLLSQVGVAVGLAIVVSKEFAGYSLGSLVITILLATTIITEIVGPIATKTAIIKAKEANV